VTVFFIGTLLIVADAARANLPLTPFEAISAAATTRGNVGPGVGFLGPFGSFEPFADGSTTVMTILMWLGRLEIISVLVICSRSYWRP
jgi:trk system potassium uptake protein TrkH